MRLRERHAGKTYFWNRRTNSTVWQAPAGVEVVWYGERDEEGEVYFWHRDTRVSTFDLPLLAIVGRALVGNRIGLALRSVGSNSMLPLVLCLRQGSHAVCPTCAQGSSVPVMGNVSDGVFWVFWFLLSVLCIWGVLVFLVSLLCTRLGLLRCASCRTCPFGRVRLGHYLCNLWEEHLKIHKVANMYFGNF